jgi:cytosine/adenosine deaminase-related metal-dependent hydrolase
MKAIINTTLYDFKNYRENAYIIFDHHIHEVGSMEHFINKNYEIIDGKDQLVMPGLVAGHTHIYSTFSRGLMMPFHPKNFQEILDQLWWRLDSYLDNEMTYYSGIVSAIDFVKSGVTTVIDHHASGVDIRGSLEALKKSVCQVVGLRGAFCFEVSDRFNVDDAIAENVDFIEKQQTNKTRGLFGLHASMSLSEETLIKVKKVLKHTPIHIHVAESELDQEDCLNKYNERIIERLARHQLLNKNSIIAHSIYVNDEELELLKKNDCVIAINFTSNMNNGVGLPNIHRFIKHGIPVIIGNDSISFSMAYEYMNVYYTNHLVDQTPNQFTLNDLKKIIEDTYQYASHTFQTKIGKLEKDFVADFMLCPYIAPTPIHENNIFAHIFFGLFHRLTPKHVWINGKEIIKNYETSEVLLRAYKDAVKASKRLFDQIEKEDKSNETKN